MGNSDETQHSEDLPGYSSYQTCYLAMCGSGGEQPGTHVWQAIYLFIHYHCYQAVLNIWSVLCVMLVYSIVHLFYASLD